MLIGSKTKSRNDPYVHLAYIINHVEINPWPPNTSLKLRSALIQWEHGDKKSGFFRGSVDRTRRGVGYGKIEFNESFRFHVTLSRDMSVESGEHETFSNNELKFNLYEQRQSDEIVEGQLLEGRLLATAVIDFAKYAIVQKGLEINADMDCKKELLVVHTAPKLKMEVACKYLETTLITASNHLPHVESMVHLPSGAGKIPEMNAVILGESLVCEEHDLTFPSIGFFKKALVPSPRKYLEMYEKSIKDPAGFWSDIASEFYWKRKWDNQVYSENLDVTKGKINIEWFKGGLTNICYNCLDKNIDSGNGDKVALLWEGNELDVRGSLTYRQLLERVFQLANFLKGKGKGVKKGDTVIIYLPMIMELPITMLACARIGAVHSVVVAGYSAESLFETIMDCKPKIVVTCNAAMRGGKKINLKEIVDDALSKSSENGISVDSCLTYENKSVMKKEDTTKWQEGRDIWWQDAVPKCSPTCEVEWVDAEDPLFLLYASGSTGKPKGVLHTPGGYMIHTATTFKYAFDYKESDIYWCTADCGWITGHSYVTYGPLLNGATVVLYEGVPNYLDAGRCWNIVDKYKVTLFYTAPTLVRSLVCDGKEITPLPGALPQKPGSATFPFLGVKPVIVDENGKEIDGECSGSLCIKSSWPGAFRTLYGDRERYEATYFKRFPGYYFSGYGCSRDNDGYHWLTGRVDDVINDSGLRIGTAEVDSALVSHPQRAEAA